MARKPDSGWLEGGMAGWLDGCQLAGMAGWIDRWMDSLAG